MRRSSGAHSPALLGWVLTKKATAVAWGDIVLSQDDGREIATRDLVRLAVTQARGHAGYLPSPPGFYVVARSYDP